MIALLIKMTHVTEFLRIFDLLGFMIYIEPISIIKKILLNIDPLKYQLLPFDGLNQFDMERYFEFRVINGENSSSS